MKHFSELSETAERVVDAAQGLIQHRGYNGFSYEDIARLVGIRKASVHHHFSTKAELVTVVVQRYTHRFRQQLLQIEGQHAKAPERLLAYAARFEQTFEQEGSLCICGILGAEIDTLDASIKAEVERFFEVNLDWLAQVLRQGQAAGLIHKRATAQELADAYLCALEGAMIVGRGLGRGAGGPAPVAKTFIACAMS